MCILYYHVDCMHIVSVDIYRLPDGVIIVRGYYVYLQANISMVNFHGLVRAMNYCTEHVQQVNYVRYNKIECDKIHVIPKEKRFFFLPAKR